MISVSVRLEPDLNNLNHSKVIIKWYLIKLDVMDEFNLVSSLYFIFLTILQRHF